ncbi:MAG: CRISPR-associated endoribonuclease Cas2 1 [Pirellulaceae bacterium]|jgi:CRISPR-associated protein Cas2|uniref:CRISPR-associated endonuclease Cas2 n=1 Tax=Caldilinea sp. TaxID=2293560 RepID=UPI0021DF247D|nr:CRISPR-associated endonuclease Cas2 [uncultured Caldilinea sp.]GIW89758.1 MAG: CRISPR-associated endoribonuclease Cas2 1 [Pirellulaceae bacterium]
MRGKRFLVISYDIVDDRRRLKVAKTLLDFGAQRVQRSVFECYITPANQEKLRQRLQRLIDEQEDSVRFYRLCDECLTTVERMGVAAPIDEPGLLII